MKYISGKTSVKFLTLFFVFVGMEILAQSTTLKLPTTNNTSSFDIVKSDSTSIFKLFGDGGFYVGGAINIGELPIEGNGTRLLWYPKKAAFRVGRVTSSQWNDINIGQFSVGMGVNNQASGHSSIALGYETTASGTSSLSIGSGGTANGNYSIALGTGVQATGDHSIAIGYLTNASGFMSTAIGDHALASGNYSTALGNFVSTNSKSGSFIIGDRTTSYTYSSGDDQMTMRFAGGYRLFTNSASNIGAYLTPNSNSWTAVSDSTKKENFINADGEYFLNSLSKLKLGSWNYKTQDSKEYRHYGPMAQEIFHYFGKDEIGTIGNDTTLATADMDGIMMIMLQALEKRTNELQNAKEEIVELKVKILNTEKKQEITDAKLESLNQLITQMVSNKSSENEYSYLNDENKK